MNTCAHVIVCSVEGIRRVVVWVFVPLLCMASGAVLSINGRWQW